MSIKKNHICLQFDARPVNEGFARMAVAAFMVDMNPTMEVLEDVKTAVSEAVTNAIIHGYTDETSQVTMECIQHGEELEVIVTDEGIGIEDLEKAMQPFYTSKPQMERSGMGFAFMEAFMDQVHVESEPGKGTRVCMRKYIEREHER